MVGHCRGGSRTAAGQSRDPAHCGSIGGCCDAEQAWKAVGVLPGGASVHSYLGLS